MNNKNIIWLILGGLVVLLTVWYLFGDPWSDIKGVAEDVYEGASKVTGKVIQHAGTGLKRGAQFVTGAIEAAGEKVTEFGEHLEEEGPI